LFIILPISGFSPIIGSMRQNKLLTLLALGILTGLTLLFFWKILLTNLILSGVDTFLYFYPYKAYAAAALRQGRLPLWNPHLFMGAPLLANSQVGLFYPLNWLFIWLDAPKQVAWSIGLHITLAGLFMLALARCSRQLSWPASLITATLFAFGGYLGAQVEHINQLQAAAWLPLLFLLYDLCIQRRRGWFWLLLLALIIALTLLAGHAQTTFISLFGLGLYALWQAIVESNKEGFARLQSVGQVDSSTATSSVTPALRAGARVTLRGRSSLITHHSSLILRSLLRHLWPLAVASLLAVALAALQLWPTAELSNLSIRRSGLTFRETVSFSLRPTGLHYTLLPPFNLDLTQVLGEAFSEWVAYLGISGLILAILGGLMAIWRPPARRFVFISGSGLILSLGLYTGPLYLLLYKFAPGFNLFRVPARWLLLYAFGMAVLAGFGFESLVAPTQLRDRLASIRRWLLASRPRLLLLILPLLFLLALIAWKTPPLTTLLAWLIFATLTLSLIYYVLRFTFYGPRLNLLLTTFSLLLFLELFWAAQALNYNQPTAPQAYHSIRNATAFLLAQDPPENIHHSSPPPDRFLSLSDITYDPGDLAELRQVYGDHLSEKALYNLIVATKEKEVLFFNLPLLYGLHSVDGYDGGVLPLAQFVTLQELFLPEDGLSFDGRLREKLRFVPAGRLLSLLNTRWIITDKLFDVWIEGIFYDLQFPAYLDPGQTIATTDIPDFPATALGLVSHLQGATELPDDTPAAELTVTFSDGSQNTFMVKAGLDTAEGHYPSGEGSEAAHRQAKVGVTWPYQADGVDYITYYTLTANRPISAITVKALLPAGQLVLRGLSLIHQPTNTSRSVILSTEGVYRQVHSGDVKVYENLAVLPRAFIIHRTEIVSSDRQAITLIQNPQFDPAAALVRLAVAGEASGLITSGQPSPRDAAEIVSYAPERVEIAVTLDSPGWLVLTDAYYPGWQATLDGQPVEILQADILFRAIAVPEGTHSLVFEFKPASFRQGLMVSSLALLATLIGLIVARQLR
jgi:hypothetical protein